VAEVLLAQIFVAEVLRAQVLLAQILGAQILLAEVLRAEVFVAEILGAQVLFAGNRFARRRHIGLLGGLQSADQRFLFDGHVRLLCFESFGIYLPFTPISNAALVPKSRYTDSKQPVLERKHLQGARWRGHAGLRVKTYALVKF
jgi:hypothetical protein